MFKKITIIGGAGHVGLAFALICAKNNIKVHLNDTNSKALNLIKSSKMPHKETGGQKILNFATKNNLLSFSDNLNDLQLSKINIICVGTPVDEFLNPNHNILISLMKDLSKLIKNNQHFIIRSTVYPGTTEYLHKFLKSKNKKINLTFCPERFVQGSAIIEFKKFPQIIGSIDKKSEKECKNFLKLISKEIVVLKPVEAELTKLFLNSYRYIQFATANQFFKIADSLGLNYKNIDYAMRHNYKRGKNIPSPGFTSGPCLFKDTMQLHAFAQNNFALGMNSMSANEGLIYYVVEKLKKEFDLNKKIVGILGMAFKAEIDDTRSSLSYKLKKILTINAKKVLTTDPYVKNDKEIISLKETIAKSDILILATPHKIYKKINTKKPIVDIWNFIQK